MLDLKAQLLKAGLVTAEQVKKVEDESAKQKPRKNDDDDRWRKRLDDLKAAPKSEQYEIIRGWVERHRLDPKTAIPSDGASRFHFTKDDAGTIGHVTLEPDVQARVASGEAGIVTFMGHNGLEHAVVPADLAKDIHHAKPEWVRVLAGVVG